MSSDDYVDDEFEPAFESKEPDVGDNKKTVTSSSSSSSSVAKPLTASGE